MTISAAVTVVVLAVVIVTAAALSPPKEESPKTPAGNTADKAALLLGQAEDAERSGDTTTALIVARRALEADPGNQEARVFVKKLEQKSDGDVPGSDSTGDNGSNKSDPDTSGDTQDSPDKGFLTPVKNLTALLPRKFTSYSLGDVVEMQGDVSVGATPKQAGEKAVSILWAVHDGKSKAGAKRFIDRTSSVSYSSDKARVTVDGVSAYSGTDGTRFATVSYVRGRYVFEVIVAGNDGNPKGLRSLAIKAAEQFADAPTK